MRRRREAMERMVPHTRRHFWSPDKLEKIIIKWKSFFFQSWNIFWFWKSSFSNVEIYFDGQPVVVKSMSRSPQAEPWIWFPANLFVSGHIFFSLSLSFFLSISLFVFGLDSKNVSESKKMKASSCKMPICVWLLIKTIIYLKWFCSYIGCEFESSCTPGGMMDTGCILELYRPYKVCSIAHVAKNVELKIEGHGWPLLFGLEIFFLRTLIEEWQGKPFDHRSVSVWPTFMNHWLTCVFRGILCSTNLHFTG